MARNRFDRGIGTNRQGILNNYDKVKALMQKLDKQIDIQQWNGNDKK